MSGNGDVIRIYDGTELTVLERPDGPGGKLVMRFALPDGCLSPPPHTHPYSTEVFTVEEGSFELLADREWKRFDAGETLTVEPGTRHTFRNRSGATAVVHNVHDPHHDFEGYIRRVAALTQELQATRIDSPIVVTKAAMIFSDYPDLIRPTDLPLRIAFPALNAVGRLLRLSVPR